MKLSVLSVSSENVPQDYIHEMETFSGKAAGVCYMKDDYFDTYVTDPQKAEKRFDRVISTGHHSISDHSFISVLFEGMPKITAMILNSVGFYNTSEKSGRYTIMGGSDKNTELYKKWFNIFYDKIITHDQKIDKQQDGTEDDTLRKKLAQENARYMLSVFDPTTTMVYTTSLRMWSYIAEWCEVYVNTADESTPFNVLVKKCVHDLYDKIVEVGCYSPKIIDNKNKQFNFLSQQVDYPIFSAREIYCDSYLIKYKVSFASLAQLQRHRTLDYFMNFNGENMTFYLPKLLQLPENHELALEWCKDLELIKDTYPCATLVDVVETGFISNFMLKCDERLCGRTQLETFENVRTCLLKFARDWNKSPFSIHEIERHFKDGKVIMKCGNIKCQEPCYWGPIVSQYKSI